MSDRLVPTGPSGSPGDGQLQSWYEPRPPLPALATSPLERPVAALRRYKWLIVAVVALAVGGGIVATRLVTPLYEVRASIMIATESPMENRTGPIRSTGLLTSDDWTQLLKSFTISDAVVRKLSLYLRPSDAKDAELFAGFTLADRFLPGQYELVVQRAAKRWTLAAEPSDVVIDSGGVSDPVGRAAGFFWLLPTTAFDGSGTRTVRFTVVTPREVAVGLVSRLKTQRQQQSNFLLLTLEDSDPQRAARILNTWVNEFVSVAATLKKRKLVQFGQTLEGQLQTAKRSLDSSEVLLSSFRVNTITQPSEGGPIAAGVQETRDPVIKAYFEKKIEYDDIRHDVGVLQRLIANSRDSLPADELLQIRSVASGSPAGQALRSAMADYHTAESNLAVARAGYTDEHPIVKELTAQVNTLRRVQIPQRAAELLASLRSRATDDSLRISGASVNLQQIPQRTIEEERLRRVRDINSGLYTNLQNRYSEAQLAEASATPDVSVLDSAIAPLSPTNNTAPRILFMAIVGGLGAALGLAILLDRLDARLRYPEQVGTDLGLSIAGTVPRIPKTGVDQNSAEQTFQLVESFRSLRMSVMHASDGRSVSIAISSPSPGEGKSLVAANLALSFADAGLRTALVDGDTRRGSLHDIFSLQSNPGLTDYLAGAASLEEVAHQTSQSSLTMIACGTRKRRSPELLTSSRLLDLVAELRATHDVVIIDTPPLAAGIDAYSIAAAAGGLLVVLRVGQTTRRMAAEKLRLFDRLPVDIVGAVLNGIKLDGEYAYYSYVPGYQADDDAPGMQVKRVN
ncbi:MAG TPA: polysaccharide biosynthesis tyrosine autokinase [Gemmatimonadaceae bacterium]|nr:polysaccharide biosynthesis tyrosine autokinase [Gemmatimonadaceae bacterium]